VTGGGTTDHAVDFTTEAGLRRDTALVTLCTLVSRITGFGRVIATAAVLGSGLLGDVYQTANLMPNLLFELVAGGVLQAVLVPSFVEARRVGGRRLLTDAVLGLLTLVGMALSPVLTRLMVAAEPSAATAADKLDVMLPMVLVFVPQLLFYGLATVAGAALNARGRFVAAALSPTVNNVIVIVACLWFRHLRGGAPASLDLTPMQMAVLAGGTTLGVVAFAVLPMVVLRREGVGWRPTWSPGHTAVVSMRSQFGWATLSIVGTLVPTAAALALGNGATGGVAVFMYAFAFYVLPHALVAVPLATTLAPRVADRWQERDAATARSIIDSSMRLAVPLLLLGGAGMVGLAWPVTRVAAFGQTASQGFAPIAHTLAAFGPGLLGYGIAFVMTRVLFAIGDVRRASMLMIFAAGSGVATMVLASQMMANSERAAALAIGYGVSQTVAAVLLTGRVRSILGAPHWSVIGRVLVTSMVAAAAAVVAMLVVVARFDTTRSWSLVALLVGGAVGVAVFLAVLSAGGGRQFLRLQRG
jgi:putative peptidoglycan lipid II flippase